MSSPTYPERNEQIVKLWNNGLTSRMIGDQFGITRNAVLGVVHRNINAVTREIKRMKPRPKKGIQVVAEKVTAEQFCFKRPTMASLPVQQSSNKKIQLPAIQKTKPTHMKYKTAVHIKDVTGCKFAVTPHTHWKDEHLFCNKPTDNNKSYCEKHIKLTTQTYVPRFLRST
jgi:hypothetical protein